jgi:prophage regulatory protein|tara:strand:+ start:82 stop:318 length:237 start_codon:yes stop_codon:yes gene_type:complete
MNFTNDSIEKNENRLIRLPEVISKVGYARSNIYKLIADGEFPKQVRLGKRAVAWRERDINQWIEERAVEELPSNDLFN